MPPKFGIFGNVSDLPYLFFQEYRSLPFFDRYRGVLNINCHLREISHRHLRFHRLSKPCLLSLRRSPRCARQFQGDLLSGQDSARGDVDLRQPVCRAIGWVRRGTCSSARSLFPCSISAFLHLYSFAFVASLQLGRGSQSVKRAPVFSRSDRQSWSPWVY